jgi:hypothetical protein
MSLGRCSPGATRAVGRSVGRVETDLGVQSRAEPARTARLYVRSSLETEPFEDYAYDCRRRCRPIPTSAVDLDDDHCYCCCDYELNGDFNVLRRALIATGTVCCFFVISQCILIQPCPQVTCCPNGHCITLILSTLLLLR